MAEEDLLPLLGLHMHAENDSDDSSDSSTDDMEASEEGEVEEQEEREEREEKKSRKKKDPKKASNTTITFDSSLPSSHSYLGNDLEELHGRTILEDDSVVSLPLLTLPGMILVPGQIIPLHLFHHHTVAMIKNVIDNDKTFGVVAIRTTAMDDNHSLAGIGTTAEIFSVKNEMDEGSGIATIRVIARGRQRFELMEYHRSLTGVLIGKVKILPDIDLADTFESIRPQSHCRLCFGVDDEENLKTALDRHGNVLSCVNMRTKGRVDRFTAAHYTWWPPWVYKMYDAANLIRRIKSELQKWNETFRPEKMPNDVTDLSYWVTQHLPLDDTSRLHLLSINNSVQRLRCALSMVLKYSVLCCQECSQQIADKNEVFSLAVEGPLGAYVNPGGHVHETLTVYKANNLNLIGRPSTEHSWFPGYAWTIAQCRNCASHMGWRFTARSKDLSPQKFWGLCRSSLAPGISNPNQSESPDWMPVM